MSVKVFKSLDKIKAFFYGLFCVLKTEQKAKSWSSPLFRGYLKHRTENELLHILFAADCTVYPMEECLCTLTEDSDDIVSLVRTIQEDVLAGKSRIDLEQDFIAIDDNGYRTSDNIVSLFTDKQWQHILSSLTQEDFQSLQYSTF